LGRVSVSVGRHQFIRVVFPEDTLVNYWGAVHWLHGREGRAGRSLGSREDPCHCAVKQRGNTNSVRHSTERVLRPQLMTIKTEPIGFQRDGGVPGDCGKMVFKSNKVESGASLHALQAGKGEGNKLMLTETRCERREGCRGELKDNLRRSPDRGGVKMGKKIGISQRKLHRRMVGKLAASGLRSVWERADVEKLRDETCLN